MSVKPKTLIANADDAEALITEEVPVTYKCIDGAHFFVSGGPATAGLCVAHPDIMVAYAEVSRQLTAIYEFRHGKRVEISPKVPAEKFAALVSALKDATYRHVQAGTVTPAAIQPWIIEGSKGRKVRVGR